MPMSPHELLRGERMPEPQQQGQNPHTVTEHSATRLGRLKRWLGLNPNMVVMLTAVLLVGSGEALWINFLPKYLQALGATAWIIGAYGSLAELIRTVYKYPSGWLADWLGRRKVLVLFTLMATVGYTVYLSSPSWEWVIFGTFFVGVSWKSLTLPGTFSVVGDNLPSNRRDIGLGLHALTERVSLVLLAPLGGWLITGSLTLVKQPGQNRRENAVQDYDALSSGLFGPIGGIKTGLGITIVLALIAVGIILRYYVERAPSAVGRPRFSFADGWRSMDAHLKWMLAADCMVLWAEWVIKVFIILYVVDVLGVSAFGFGILLSIDKLMGLLLLIPGAKLSERLGRPPFVLAAYGFRTLFPLVLVSASGLFWVVLAFMVRGLNDIGEPARRALLVDRAREMARGRVIGTYHLIRGVAIFPASLVGGWLWTISEQLPFYAAFLIGAIGFLTYAMWVRTEKSLAHKSSNQPIYRKED